MRKSCAQFVYSAVVLCGRTHGLCAATWVPSEQSVGSRVVIPRLLRTKVGLFYTARYARFTSVFYLLFPTFHMTNNNYNSVYIPI